ncbi:hypothetical protein K8R66_00300 [bacterium]|nr:hypothetical protein [bacterium]
MKFKKITTFLLLSLLVISLSACGKKVEEKISIENISYEEKNLVEKYLQKNISELSSKKETLGGKFYLTNLELNNNSGLIKYEDGHIELQANFNYQIKNQNVKIDNFQIIENKSLITEAHFKCDAHDDCIPKPSCHPRECINKKYQNNYAQPEICTMMHDNCAAYHQDDCLCQQGICFNENLMNPECNN